MSMHTAQHLLSALLESELSLPTLGWSLSAWPSAAYVDLPRPLTVAETAQVQNKANEVAFEGRSVHIEVQELKDGEQGIDSGEASSARELGRGLPKDYTGGVHRVVVIDGIDRNPCCGTHLPSLTSLQLYLFPPPPTSSVPARHYFLAGPRLLSHIGTTQTQLSRVSGLLSCGSSEAPDRIALVLDESKKREKRVDEVERELADHIGRQLVEEMIQWRSEGGEGEWTKYIGRTDDSPTALTLLQAITFAFIAHLPSDSTHQYTLLLTSSPSSQTTTSTTVCMLLGSDDKRVKETGDVLKKQFSSLKGGGRGARWSGKSVGVWLADREGKAASSVLTQGSTSA
ncbi:hypothetical protein EVG20_g42 [Dentipellis fragilis]|uniref:Threonyl/alanyl tRNA synthetase SAD domain-containing protein n=1 Tax=Dentipellis fragilis TaxID=205917 RepID=A0A4Y9ZG45_9AGAM|nr:hypothetical protein EVG20_g42 [Dentipellis fragilis]